MQLFKITSADITDLKNLTTTTLVSELTPLMQGTADDLKAYASAIVGDSIDATLAGDKDTLIQLKDQSRALMEANRVRIVPGLEHSAAAVTSAVLGFALRLAANAVIPGAGALINSLLPVLGVPAPAATA